MESSEAAETPTAPSAGREQVPPPSTAYGGRPFDGSRLETKATEPDAAPGASHGPPRDLDKGRGREPPSPADPGAPWGDDRSVSSYARSEQTVQGSEDTEGTSYAASVFAEPLRLHDGGDASPLRRSSLPPRAGGPRRSDTVDSDASSAPRPPCNLRAQYHPTFPLNSWSAEGHPSDEPPPPPPSALRAVTYPPPSPPSPTAELGFPHEAAVALRTMADLPDRSVVDPGDADELTPQGSESNGDTDGDIR